jgi:hypothetical protein
MGRFKNVLVLLLLDSGTWAGLIPSPPLAMDDCAATELALLCDADDWLAPSCLVVKKLLINAVHVSALTF